MAVPNNFDVVVIVDDSVRFTVNGIFSVCGMSLMVYLQRLSMVYFTVALSNPANKLRLRFVEYQSLHS